MKEYIRKLLNILGRYLLNKTATPRKEEPPHYKEIISKDTYEVAFYVMNGASVTNVSQKKVAENKASRLGFRYEWTFTVKVDEKYINLWNINNAYGNIKKFRSARLKIKRLLPKPKSKIKKKVLEKLEVTEPMYRIKGQYYE